MSKRIKVKVHSPGIRRILKSAEVRGVVNGAAREVAAAAQAATDDEVTLAEYTTDREAASVGIPADTQAKHGTLTRAARSTGLEVRES